MGDDVQAMKNKIFRGRVLRTLDNYYPKAIELREVKATLQSGGMTVISDIYRIIDYLIDKGYVKSLDGSEMLADDDLVKLTAKGIDLLENTINDEGVNVL